MSLLHTEILIVLGEYSDVKCDFNSQHTDILIVLVEYSNVKCHFNTLECVNEKWKRIWVPLL